MLIFEHFILELGLKMVSTLNKLKMITNDSIRVVKRFNCVGNWNDSPISGSFALNKNQLFRCLIIFSKIYFQFIKFSTRLNLYIHNPWKIVLISPWEKWCVHFLRPLKQMIYRSVITGSWCNQKILILMPGW